LALEFVRSARASSPGLRHPALLKPTGEIVASTLSLRLDRFLEENVMHPMKNLLRNMVALVAGAACALGVLAQATYPNRPLQLVVIQPPGTTTDVVARAIADKLGQRLGAPIVVVNKAGGGGTIATEFVAKASPDGYTFLVSNAAMAANPFLFKRLPYDTSRDFVPVGLLGESPYLVIVNNGLGAKNIKDFIAYAKQHPGRVNYASGGVGSGTHLTCALFAAKAGIQMTHIPYTQASAIGTDLIGGLVQVMCPPTPSAAQLVRDGKTTILGSSAHVDMKEPFVAPSISRSARIDFHSMNWNGLFAPSKTPTDVLAKMQTALVQTLEDPEVQQRFKAMGMTPRPLVGPQFQSYFRAELAKWGPVVKASGATLD